MRQSEALPQRNPSLLEAPRRQQGGAGLPLDRPGRFDKYPFGFVHIDLKHLPSLRRVKSYVFVAIERATRFVHAEIITSRDAPTVAACLLMLPGSLSPATASTPASTFDGSESTDAYSFAVDGLGNAKRKALQKIYLFQQGLRRRAHQAQAHQALPPADQRHGGTLQPPHRPGHQRRPRRQPQRRQKQIRHPR